MTADTCWSVTGSTRPSWLRSPAEMDRRRAAGNLLGAAAAARVALSLLRGYAPPQVPGEWAQLRLAELDRLAGRARQVGGRGPARGRRLDGGRRRRDGRGGSRRIRRGVAAGLAARLRRRRPGRRGPGRLRPGPGAARRRARHGSLPRDRRPLYRHPARRAARPGGGGGPLAGPAGLVARDEELAYLDTIAGRARGGGRGSTEIVVRGREHRHRESRPAPRLGRPAGGRRRRRAGGRLRPARPLHAAGCPAQRAVRVAPPPRARRRRRPARGPGRPDAGAPTGGVRSVVLPGRTDPGRQHARPGGAIRGAGAGAGPPGGPRPAGRGDR